MARAKLDELVTPTELLNAIKSGATKQELTKKYNTSDEELAMMLLPVYRRGGLTKEEFNSFFRGESLVRKEPPPGEPVQETPVPKAPDEPPSEILKTLSRIFHKKRAAERKVIQENGTDPSVSAEVPVKAESGTPDATIRVDNADMLVEELPVAAEPIEPTMPIIPVSRPPEPASEVEMAEIGDANTIAGALESIILRLNSIDSRLAEIEKKLVIQ
jgi:hypothetical protein